MTPNNNLASKLIPTQIIDVETIKSDTLREAISGQGNRKERRAARRKATLELKKNGASSWADLEDIYQTYLKLLRQHAGISNFRTMKHVIERIADPAGFAMKLKAVASDLRQLMSELEQIHNLHKDRGGKITAVEDFTEALGVFEQYQTWLSRHDTVLIPLVGEVLTQFQLAEQELLAEEDGKEEQPAAAAQEVDPEPTTEQ